MFIQCVVYTHLNKYSKKKSTSNCELKKIVFNFSASIPSLICPVGGLICSFTLDKLGRKRTLYLVNFISITSWLILAFASTTDRDLMFTQLITARVIIGISTGFSTGPSSIYTAEIAHPKIRGRLVVVASCSIASGIMIIYLLGYFIPVRTKTFGFIRTPNDINLKYYFRIIGDLSAALHVSFV